MQEGIRKVGDEHKVVVVSVGVWGIFDKKITEKVFVELPQLGLKIDVTSIVTKALSSQ